MGGIHRDIKPSNILLFGNSENPDYMNLKLTDFGSGDIKLWREHLASELEKGDHNLERVMQYWAPEMHEKYLKEDIDIQVDNKIDVWSICQVFYRVSTLV